MVADALRILACFALGWCAAGLLAHLVLGRGSAAFLHLGVRPLGLCLLAALVLLVALPARKEATHE